VVRRCRSPLLETNYCARCQTGGVLLADRSLSRLLKDDWPRSLEEMDAARGGGSETTAPGCGGGASAATPAGPGARTRQAGGRDGHESRLGRGSGAAGAPPPHPARRT